MAVYCPVAVETLYCFVEKSFSIIVIVSIKFDEVVVEQGKRDRKKAARREEDREDIEKRQEKDGGYERGKK